MKSNVRVMFKRSPSTAQQLVETAAKLAASEEALKIATDCIDMLEKRMNERAAIISIVRDGRKIRFGFVRNQQLIYIETVGMWSDDVDGWKQQLLSQGE